MRWRGEWREWGEHERLWQGCAIEAWGEGGRKGRSRPNSKRCGRATNVPVIVNRLFNGSSHSLILAASSAAAAAASTESSPPPAKIPALACSNSSSLSTPMFLSSTSLVSCSAMSPSTGARALAELPVSSLSPVFPFGSITRTASLRPRGSISQFVEMQITFPSVLVTVSLRLFWPFECKSSHDACAGSCGSPNRSTLPTHPAMNPCPTVPAFPPWWRRRRWWRWRLSWRRGGEVAGVFALRGC